MDNGLITDSLTEAAKVFAQSVVAACSAEENLRQLEIFSDLAAKRIQEFLKERTGGRSFRIPAELVGAKLAERLRSDEALGILAGNPGCVYYSDCAIDPKVLQYRDLVLQELESIMAPFMRNSSL